MLGAWCLGGVPRRAQDLFGIAGLDGEEVYREISRIRPDVQVVLSSGYGEERVSSRVKGRGPLAFVHKPYRVAALLETVNSALAGV